ncbi:hypothetical protein Tco_1543140, partial [Tanacetum coccineum]
MNDSLGSVNENGFFNNDINIDQLRSNIEQLMDDNPVLTLNTNANNVINNTKIVLMVEKGSNKGSLLDQFRKSRDASSSKQSSYSDSDESEVEEVSMPYSKQGGGFLDDLDCYDGYEAQLYELTKQQRAICDRFDIRLNSRCRKHGYAVSSLMDTAYWLSEHHDEYSIISLARMHISTAKAKEYND